MEIKTLKRYLLQLPEAWEDFPFGPDVAVYKLNKKMFALLSHNNEGYNMNLKCDPEQAFMLRDIFTAVIPGYHMNKKHWNTVILDNSIPEGEIERMIDHSYTLVAKSLPKRERTPLELRHGTERFYPDQQFR